MSRGTTPITDGGNIQNLAVVGGVHFDGLCRITSGTGAGGSERANHQGLQHAADPNWAVNGETEAKIIVWSETGTLAFKGDAGPRQNVPAGSPDYSVPAGNEFVTGDPNTNPNADRVNGEGQHMLVHATNETADEERPVGGVIPAFGSTSSWVATSGGADMLVSAFAGLDVLGVGPDSCVFSGLIQQL